MSRCRPVLSQCHVACHVVFFFNDTAPTESYTLSLHDALPISLPPIRHATPTLHETGNDAAPAVNMEAPRRSEEHTSELQSRENLVCRLLLEKKKKTEPTSNRPHTQHHTRHLSHLHTTRLDVSG